MFELSKKESSRGRPNQAKSQDSAHGESARASDPRSASTGIAVIGRSIKIDGALSGDEDLRIEGDVSGTIKLPNHCLTIGKGGRITADAYAKSMMIEGEVNGDLYSSECITIRASAKVKGNVLATRVSLEEGARFRGSIDMDLKSVESALGQREIQAVTSDAGKPERAKQATLANVNSPPKEPGAAQHAASDTSLKSKPAH